MNRFLGTMNRFLGTIREFINATMAEINKCTWPKRAELFESTILTIVVIVLLSSFVFVVDKISRILINFITGTL
ncbi:MAG: preprotein translocase subunit SecE [Victivallaceae bacterium]|nr:preprotein translocase subunit SecE [Victivallaceae bacterium]